MMDEEFLRADADDQKLFAQVVEFYQRALKGSNREKWTHREKGTGVGSA